jgi:hypothetical protein
VTKSIEKQQAAMAAATIAQRVGSDTSATAAPLNAFCKFANATAAAVAHVTATPSHWLCSAKESESESESPLGMAGDVGGGRGCKVRRGACSVSHVGSVRKSRGTHRHPRHPTVVALKPFLASQSFLLLCEFCAKVHQGGGHDGELCAEHGGAVAVAFAQPMPHRRRTRCGNGLAQKWRALQFQAQHEFATSSVHCASDNSPSLRRSTVTCN